MGGADQGFARHTSDQAAVPNLPLGLRACVLPAPLSSHLPWSPDIRKGPPGTGWPPGTPGCPLQPLPDLEGTASASFRIHSKLGVGCFFFVFFVLFVSRNHEMKRKETSQMIFVASVPIVSDASFQQNISPFSPGAKIITELKVPHKRASTGCLASSPLTCTGATAGPLPVCTCVHECA